MLKQILHTFEGWLTGALMWGVFVLASKIFSPTLSLILAITGRILFTRARNEDNLFCFFNKFSDSNTNSYGILTLIVYMPLLFCSLHELPAIWLPCIMFAGNCISKFCASLVDLLPKQGRKQELSVMFIIDLVLGIAPIFLFVPDMFWIATVAPLLVSCLLFYLSVTTMQTYINNNYGTVFVLSELAFYMTVNSLIYINSLPQILN